LYGATTLLTLTREQGTAAASSLASTSAASKAPTHTCTRASSSSRRRTSRFIPSILSTGWDLQSGGDLTLPIDVLIPAAVIVFIGYVVFGVTGFGASPITIPMLAHFLSLTLVLALAAILDLASALVLSVHTRKQADRRELYVLVPFTLAGLVLGVTLLVNLPRSATLFALGAFVCAYALYAALRRDPPHGLSRRWAVPAGFSGGVLGALFGIGGPPYVMYLTGRVADPVIRRATISQMVTLSVGLRVAVFALAGLFYPRDLWGSVALLLPVAWSGVWVGNRLQMRLPPAILARIIAGALFATGVSLIVRTL